MVDQVVLVIVLGFVELLQRRYLRHDLVREDFGAVQLRDVAFRDPLLFVVRVKDRRAVLGTSVRPAGSIP
jgi:hypothetical protein